MASTTLKHQALGRLGGELQSLSTRAKVLDGALECLTARETSYHYVMHRLAFSTVADVFSLTHGGYSGYRHSLRASVADG
jgi:hypothetical protein